jgi:hypothetical protein
MLKKKLKSIIESPMSDADIKVYLPNAKILEYSSLADYDNIEEILSKPKDFVILLYRESPQFGHWCCVCYDIDNSISYFDPYGLTVDAPLKYWNTKQENKLLGQSVLYLTNLLNKTKKKVKYNDVNYQSSYNPNTSTCGAHCIFRILNMIKNDLDLKKYYSFMKKLRKKEKLTFDEIVAKYINIR